MGAEPGKLRERVTMLVRVVAGLGLAGLLVYLTLKRGGGNLLAELRHGHPGWLAAAVILYGAIILITVYRLRLLLRIQGIEFPAGELTRLTMIGVFFNMLIPGAVGGDLVKMAYITRETPGRRAEAVLTIMLDRIVGIFGLFIIASLMILVFWSFLMAQDAKLRAAALVVGFGSVSGVLAVLALETREAFLRVGLIARLCAALDRRLPARLTGLVRRAVAALDLYRRNRGIALAAVGMSLAVHFGLAVTLFCIGAGIGERKLRFLDYLLVTQVGNAVGAIPVTPAGVGTRDAVITLFFEAMQGAPEKCAVIAVTLSLIILFYALVGAVVFVCSPRVRAAKQAE